MDELKNEIEQNNKVWSGKGRPPRALAEKVKQQTAEKKALRVKQNRKGDLIVDPKAKLELFLQEYLRNDGNATQAALAIGNHTSVVGASVQGSRLLKRAKDLGLVRTMLEKKGYGQGKLLDVALQKMTESKTPEWWDRLMKMADYEDFINKKEANTTSIVNIVGAQRQQMEDFGFANEGEVINDQE